MVGPAGLWPVGGKTETQILPEVTRTQSVNSFLEAGQGCACTTDCYFKIQTLNI